MAKITYRETDGPRGRRVKVMLDGKYVGTIMPDGVRWVYFPKGSNVPSQSFHSVEAVKRSLEVER